MRETGNKTHMRPIGIPVTVLLLASIVSAADTKPPKPPKAPPAPKAHANTGPGGGPAAPKRATDQQIEKLANMSPAQRERALANVPPERRAKIEAGIAKWNKSTPQERAQAEARAEKLRSLPPEQQKRIRQLAQKISSLPPDRKMAVRQELARLRKMPEADREIRLNSPAVQKNFSPDEQQILRESPALLPQNFY
jgi:Protein of unknown function (DUF3106)